MYLVAMQFQDKSVIKHIRKILNLTIKYKDLQIKKIRNKIGQLRISTI